MRSTLAGDDAVIEVSDNWGRHGARLARIFRPFFTTRPAGKALGMGLNICRGIVERHRGTIAVTSVAGRGTTFRVRLPLNAAQNGSGLAALRGSGYRGLAAE